MHKNELNLSRKEIVQQILDEEESVRDFVNDIPIGNAAEKLQKWSEQGAEICYLSALTESKTARADETVLGEEGLEADKRVLDKYGFPEGEIFHRESGEEYKDVIEKMDPLPDVLIEDDCESIGEDEITYNSLDPDTKLKIKSILIKEFGGIDHLPDNIAEI